MRCLALLFLVFAVAPVAAQESVTINADVDHRLVALRVAEEFAEPRYEVLLTRAQAQTQAWRTFCNAQPSDRNFGQLREQFAHAVTAWSNVELLRYGPVSDDFRYERIAYWPERKNDVERSLRRLLSGNDVVTVEAMPAKSVAVQGLSALERLLYADGAREDLFARDDGGARRCAAGLAIAGNVQTVARLIVDGWPQLEDRLRAADPALAREAVTRFSTDLLTVFQVVGDQKLDVPMGTDAEEARPKSAQWWRSGLSAQTLALNLKSAGDLVRILLGPGSERDVVTGALGTAQRLAEDLPRPLPDLVGDASERRRLILLRDAVRGARDLSGTYVPPALGITLGFNSLDGD